MAAAYIKPSGSTLKGGQKVSTADNRELIHQLLDDVAILEAHFAMGIPKPAVMRAGFAPILRRWIAQGVFFRAQRLAAPAQIVFTTTRNAQAIAQCRAGKYLHWMELIFCGRLGVSLTQVTEQYLEHARQYADVTSLKPSPVKASIFFKQPMFFWKGRFYTREDVIKMHANKLGGVHLDFSRTEDEEHVNEIKEYFGFEVSETGYQMLMGEEIQRGRDDRRRRDSVFDATELIAMDTARIFAGGVRRSENAFLRVLD
jgi:hypothetical protein